MTPFKSQQRLFSVIICGHRVRKSYQQLSTKSKLKSKIINICMSICWLHLCKSEITSLYIYHFSTVVDFLSEKYSGSTGHRNSWYQQRNLQWGCRWWDSNSQPLGYKPSALAIELNNTRFITEGLRVRVSLSEITSLQSIEVIGQWCYTHPES